MHHSLKIKILDLDYIESIVEQDFTDVEAEKIVGGTLSVSRSQVVPEIIVEVRPNGSLRPSLDVSLKDIINKSIKIISNKKDIIDNNTTECRLPPMPDPPCLSL